jgi:hypothetical protein
MGFASGDPDTAITASPMRRVSKRLTAIVFHESEVQGPAQLMPSTPKQPASYSGEITSSTITATSPETSAPTAFRAPIMTTAADSNSSDPKDQAVDCGSNPRATDWPTVGLDGSSRCPPSVVSHGYWLSNDSVPNRTIPFHRRRNHGHRHGVHRSLARQVGQRHRIKRRVGK